MQETTFNIFENTPIALWRAIPSQITITGISDLSGEWQFLLDNNWIDGAILTGAVSADGANLVVNMQTFDNSYVASAIKGKQALQCTATLTNGSDVYLIPVIIKNRTTLEAPQPSPINTYYTKSQTDAKFATNENLNNNYWTKQEVAAAIANIETMALVVVQELPPIAEAQEYTIYLVPASSGSQSNYYEEYLVINGSYQLIGSTAIDMSNYVEKSISGGVPTHYISWNTSGTNKNTLSISERTFRWGDGTAASVGEFYAYGSTTELRGLNVNIGWTGTSTVKHGGNAPNGPYGFVIQDGNGVIAGATDVTTTAGASLNGSMPITGTIIPVAESEQETLMETKLSDNTQIYKVTNGTGGRGTYIYVGAANAGLTHLNFSGKTLNSDVSGYISLNTPDLRLNNNNLKLTIHNNVVFNYANTGLKFTFPSDVESGGSLESVGDKIVTLQSVSNIEPKQGVIYTYTLENNDNISFGNATSGYCPTFELWLTQPATAVNFTWETTIIWNNNGNYNISNQPPILTTANKTYVLQFRFNGVNWLGNLKYTEDIETLE